MGTYFKMYFADNHDKGCLVVENYINNGKILINEFALKVENFKAMKESKTNVTELYDEYSELLNDYNEIIKYFYFARHYNHFRETEFHDTVLKHEKELVAIYENLLIYG